MIENAEDLDIVVPMYNLLEYSKNYRKTSGSLFNCYIDEPNSEVEGGINYSIRNSASFDCKKSITRMVPAYNVDVANPNQRSRIRCRN